MGNSAASDEEVIDIARKCGCYDFISNLENGFETRVGTGGNHLSGGERQRIAIARAMLKNAPVIILDEATAYTDPENEALIQSSLAHLIAILYCKMSLPHRSIKRTSLLQIYMLSCAQLI